MAQRVNEYHAMNKFGGGAVTDFDESSIPQNKYEYMLNGDITFKDGYGIITNKDGNVFQFKLSDGFAPVAYNVHKGISYILSFNTDTAESEIGCFPAPNAYINQNIALTGFSRSYAPLFNFTGANNDQFGAQTRVVFRTIGTGYLNFSFEKQPKVILREDYDKTVNIYFCDGVNTDKVINSGFEVDSGAVVTKRCYGNNSFPHVVEVLNESPLHPIVSSVDIRTGGRLKGGTYKVFARYTSYDYNPTSFLAETGMLAVTDINPSDDISTTAHPTKVRTGKLISLGLSSLDPGYNFIEVGYIRYFEDTYETVIVDKRYPITAGAATIIITGDERMINATLDQLIIKKTALNISSSITAVEERLFRSDIKKKYSHHDDLALYALAVTADEDFVALDNQTHDNAGTVSSKGLYKFWQNQYYYTGYFSTEAYPFGIVFVYTNGMESDTYPITGKDRWNAANTTNTKGIFRFPDHFNRAQKIYDAGAGKSYVMGIKFTMTAANAIYTGSAFMQSNIKGFYFVRGERKKNLKYQGLIVDIYKGTEDQSDKEDFAERISKLLVSSMGASDRELQMSNTYAPFLRNDSNTYPEFMVKSQIEASALYGLVAKTEISTFDIATVLDNMLTLVENRKALFAADHFFKMSLPKENYFIHSIGSYASLTYTAAPADYDMTAFYAKQTAYAKPGSLVTPISVKAIQQTPWNKIPLNGFVSHYDEGDPENISSLFYSNSVDQAVFGSFHLSLQAFSLAMGINSYIGLTFTGSESDSNEGDGFLNQLVNIYDSEPGSITIANMIDTKNTRYQKISQMLPMSTTGTTSAYFGGDCYICRVGQKVMFNPGKYPVNKKDDKYSLSGFGGVHAVDVTKKQFISFGTFVEYVGEFELNHDLRLTDGDRRFWPANRAIVDGSVDYAVKNVVPESDKYETAYSRADSIMQYNGFNNDLPEIITAFPNRINGSNNHILNGFKDGFRQFALGTIRDYDFGYGRITDIQTLFDQLVCIMEHHVGLVPINEKVVIGSSAGELAIGFGALLPLRQTGLSQKIGSQHRLSIINTGYAVYGIDLMLRKAWKATPNQQLEIISESAMFTKWLNQIIDAPTLGYSDILIQGHDEPYTIKGGISVGYDYKNGDIYWTFQINKDVALSEETIVYSDKFSFVKGWSTINSPFYMLLNEDFYAVNPVNTVAADALNGFWLHDAGAINGRLKYFEVAQTFLIRFVVNDKPDLEKIFKSLLINSSGDDFSKVFYETETQLSSQDPFVTVLPLDEWRKPKYREDKWALPVNRTVTAKVKANNKNAAGSKMRGNWMRVEIQSTKNSLIFVKSIFNKYTLSTH